MLFLLCCSPSLHWCSLPCYSCRHAFLVHLATLVVMPSCFHITPCYLCLVAFVLAPYYFHYFVAHTLLLTLPCFHYRTLFIALLLTPCYFALLVDGPCYLAIVPCWLLGLATHHYLLAFFKYLLPPIVASLPCYSWYSLPTPHFLVQVEELGVTPTSFIQQQRFFFLDFLSFFFLCFVFCLFVIFFELNTFCFSVVCEF